MTSREWKLPLETEPKNRRDQKKRNAFTKNGSSFNASSTTIGSEYPLFTRWIRFSDPMSEKEENFYLVRMCWPAHRRRRYFAADRIRSRADRLGGEKPAKKIYGVPSPTRWPPKLLQRIGNADWSTSRIRPLGIDESDWWNRGSVLRLPNSFDRPILCNRGVSPYVIFYHLLCQCFSSTPWGVYKGPLFSKRLHLLLSVFDVRLRCK